MPPVSTRLCIIRHGETGWNAGKRMQGQIDIPLSSVGLAQAQATGTALMQETFAAIYSSDLMRASQTAEAVASLVRLPVNLNPGLRERHFGLLQGLTTAEAAERHPAEYAQHHGRNPHFVPAGGESLLDLSVRMEKTIDSIVCCHAGEAVLVFTHGGVLDVLYRRAANMPLDAPRNFAIPNCAINWIEIDAGSWRLLRWGERDHLSSMLDEL